MSTPPDYVAEARLVLRRHPLDQELYLANVLACYGKARRDALKAAMDAAKAAKRANDEALKG